ncbi:MAG: D-alanyl-D-alanine carboxypeptidase family protein [Heteroscytonema crispum UTEX LB 1556]
MKAFRRIPYIWRILIIAAIVSFSVIISGALMLRFALSKPSVSATTSSIPSSIVSSQANSNPSVVSSAITPINSLPPEDSQIANKGEDASGNFYQEGNNLTSTTVVAANPTSIQQPLQQQATSNSVSYGHFAYAQANPNQMMIVGSYATNKDQRYETMNRDAGLAFMNMIYAAREEGVWIIPVSGFRDIQQQQKLFKGQIKRLGSTKEAAKISAPPGYSEHHTGFALDLTDGKSSKQDINVDFEKTEAFRWLTRRGKEFGFELSFGRNNPQGVSYEPWHWRYVGSQDAVAVFANARK